MRRRHGPGSQDDPAGLDTLDSDHALDREPVRPAGQPRALQPLAGGHPPDCPHPRVGPAAENDLALIRRLAGSRTEYGHDPQPQPAAVLCAGDHACYPYGQDDRLPVVQCAGRDRSPGRKTGQHGQPASFQVLHQPRPAREPVLACHHQLRRGQADRGGVGIDVVPQPLDRAGISGTRGSPQFLRHPAKLARIRTLRQSLLRHVILFARAPGPHLEA
jgi:hypothetical protein